MPGRSLECSRRPVLWNRHFSGPARLLYLAIALALTALTLLRFPPTLYDFYPQCPIHTFLHLQCPGCGATRALAALLRGHLGEALQRNALTTCALPALVFATILRSLRSRRAQATGHTLEVWKPTPGMYYAGFGVVALFTLIRNL